MMDLGLGFTADVQWFRLISSNGFRGWNQNVYKSKHFPFGAKEFELKRRKRKQVGINY